MKAMNFKDLCLVLAALLMFSCSSEQDFDNPNNPTPDSATAQLLVTGVEASMRADMNIYYWTVGVIGRDAYYLTAADPRYTGELLQADVPLDNDGFLLTRHYGSRYRTMFNLDSLLEVAANEATAEAQNGVLGYAKTMKAYQLALVLNYLYDNGIRIDVGDPPGPFVPRNDALAQIAAMLDDGYANLQSAGSAFSFNLSSGFNGFDTPSGFAQFNRGLKARISAYLGDWPGALDAVNASFIDEDGDMKLGAYMVYSAADGAAASNLNPIYENPQAGAVSFVAHPSYQADAEAGDSRYSAKVFERAEPSTQAGLSSNLAITVSSSTEDPFPILRNEELILLRAEANIQTGDLAAAEADLNRVRAAAGLAGVTLSAADQAIDQMLHERRYSLFAEGHRWVDMRRYNKLGELPLDRSGDEVVVSFPIPADESL